MPPDRAEDTESAGLGKLLSASRGQAPQLQHLTVNWHGASAASVVHNAFPAGEILFTANPKGIYLLISAAASFFLKYTSECLQ